MPKTNIKVGGSSSSISTTSAKPFQQYGYVDGATSAKESAMAKQTSMNTKQQSLIDAHGGGRRSRPYKRTKMTRKRLHRYSAKCLCKICSNKRSKKCNVCGRKKCLCKTKKNIRYKIKGGNSSSRSTVTVPQFSTSQVGPINANSSSISNNSTNLQSVADAAGDCYATNTCINATKGGRKHKKLTKKYSR